jgi:hypothetical protein
VRVFAQRGGILTSGQTLRTPLRLGLLARFRLALLMTLNTLKHRDITKINRMLEGLVGFMAIVAFVVGKRTQIDRVLKWSRLRIFFGRPGRVIDHRVADVAVVGDYFAGVAHVFAVVTAEAAREIEMADVVWMGLPIGLHLREKVSLKDALNLGHGSLDCDLLLGEYVFVIRLIELIQVLIN